MKNLPLVVGNRVTYKNKITDEIETSLVVDKEYIKYLENKDLCEILNVEACLWEKIDFEEV